MSEIADINIFFLSNQACSLSRKILVLKEKQTFRSLVLSGKHIKIDHLKKKKKPKYDA